MNGVSESPFGVGLERYAGVVVALAEGHDLALILTQERLDSVVWSQAAPVWRVRLAKSGARGDAEFMAYRGRVLEAEDILTREVAPLDREVGAWLAFVKAWGAAAAPEEFLQKHGLRTNDVSRLRRSWDARFDADRALAVRAATLAVEGSTALPVLRVGPAVLRAFPWSPAFGRAALGREASPAGDVVDSHDRYLEAHRRAQRDSARKALHPAASALAPAGRLAVTSPLMRAIDVAGLPFDARQEPVSAPPPLVPRSPHPGVGDTVELAQLTDAELAHDPRIDETVELDARVFGDLDAAAPFALRAPGRVLKKG